MKTKQQPDIRTASSETVSRVWPNLAVMGKPTVTRPRKTHAGRKTGACHCAAVDDKHVQTHSGMLHQSRTLEVSAADKPQIRHETRRARRNARCGILVVNKVEVSAGRNNSQPSPEIPQGISESGRKPHSSAQVFVLGKNHQPLMPCSPARARQLLARGRAVVHRRYPFVIRLKDRVDGDVQPLIAKIDPGATTTGMAVVRQSHTNHQTLLFAAEITHRGTSIRDSLTLRRQLRRGRRNRHTRYRPARFLNRTKPKGWVPPSLQHRVLTNLAWTHRFQRWCPLVGLATELVRFDTQLLENPEISGVEYQQGQLAGYEVREYLLEKFGRRCVYCDKSDRPLQVEHIVARSKGGSNRVSNLTLACKKCNQDKDNLPVEVFLQKDAPRLKKLLAWAKKPLASAAAVNATRNALLRALQNTGLPVCTGTGGRTKFNRTKFDLPKTHALDAACVGEVDVLLNTSIPALGIKCCGRGSRKRTRLTAEGFPRGYLTRRKSHFGFRTGDIVIARVTRGTKAGVYRGRVAVRKSGSFNIQSSSGTIQGISHHNCRTVQRSDGYNYLTTLAALPPSP